VNGIHGTVVQLEVPALHQWLNIVGSCVVELLQRIDAIEDRDRVIYSVQLAVHETCTNIIDHAYTGCSDGRINITLTWIESARRLVVDVRDTGEPFDINQVPEPSLEVPQVHGYGLFLIRNLVDEVTYTPQSFGNHWQLVKRL
jgi:serine/threonine-protein kinase RsbW